MPFMLFGLIGRDLSRQIPQNVLEHSAVTLPQGFEYLPLTPDAVERLATDDVYDPAAVTGSYWLSRRFCTALAALAPGPFGYLEIDCEGGSCQRAAALFWRGQTIWTGSHIDTDVTVLAGTSDRRYDLSWLCTNELLRSLGVERLGSRDELAALGLDRVPYGEAWRWPAGYRPDLMADTDSAEE